MKKLLLAALLFHSSLLPVNTTSCWRLDNHWLTGGFSLTGLTGLIGIIISIAMTKPTPPECVENLITHQVYCPVPTGEQVWMQCGGAISAIVFSIGMVRLIMLKFGRRSQESEQEREPLRP